MLNVSCIKIASSVAVYVLVLVNCWSFTTAMAGNIIPAIATTNAVIAGLIVMEALKILSGRIADCRTVVLKTQPNPRKKLLDPCVIDKPNPKCYVCSEKPEVSVGLNIAHWTVRGLHDKVKH